MKRIIILFFLLLIITFSVADTHIPAGNVNGVWTFPNSPYIIDGEISIQQGDELTIEPGIQVIFSSHYKFNIYGRILAEGTQNDTIIFTICDTTGFSNFYSNAGSWHSLRFYDTNTNGQDSSKVIYCKLEYGKATTGGSSGIYGGAIKFYNSSDILVKHCSITENIAVSGGGICCYPNSSPCLEDVIIKGNIAKSGAGMYCRDNSHPYLKNVNVVDNHAISFSGGGGGIYCENNASPHLDNVTIKGNSAFYCGGGIYIRFDSSPILENVTISENNTDNFGGGIYCSHNSFPIFDSTNRCNIFLNSSGSGSDLYVDYICPTINVIVDTFTVLEPDNYFAYPLDNFTFDIQNSKVEQVNHDLYVSPSGSDDNSGLSPDQSLLTIAHALRKIIANINYPHDIYLANGIYSQSQTTEHFPLNCKSFVSFIGEDEELTILNGEELKGILFCEGDSCFSIEKMTIQNGFRRNGGGIYLTSRSSPSLENIIIRQNEAYYSGGGIYCGDNSNPKLNNVILSENSASNGGGLYCHYYSNPSLNNVTIKENTANLGGGICLEAYSDASLMNVAINENHGNNGGGIYLWDSSPILTNVIISENTTNNKGGGIYCTGLYIAGYFIFSRPILTNVTISRNMSLDNGGGIYCWECSSPTLLNCILWDNTPEEVYFSPEGDSISITISYSDIQNGEVGIVTNNNGTVNWLEGNIDSDPLFADPQNGDFHLTWVNFPIPDSTMSPCIDAGDPNSPLDPDGTIADMGAFYFDQNQQGVEDISILKPSNILYQNYPNPFKPLGTGRSPATTISFSLAKYAKNTEIIIYNIKGQKVKEFPIVTPSPAHTLSVTWNGTDDNSRPVGSGIYFYSLKIDNKTVSTKKCLLIK
ncbi:MAG: T9SS type A sorting domain-containing protein [Candidatus Cloacimonetes bacterium]|nr:T9SS type A sorting domain-containing protein [Candidatus Cloacimonadota bacterium]